VDSLQKTRKTSPDHKSIVFSQYTNFLDIIEWKLRQEGFAPVKLVGSMPMTMRTSVSEILRRQYCLLSSISSCIISSTAQQQLIPIQGPMVYDHTYTDPLFCLC
jgi:hypothetical protein